MSGLRQHGGLSRGIWLVLILLLALATFQVRTSRAATIVYVDADAKGKADGTSWNNAYTDLQAAVSKNTSGEIWVAAGTYRPTSAAFRGSSFILTGTLELYGGFAG